MKRAAAELRKYREAASDYRQTCDLRTDIQTALSRRNSKHLILSEFERIARWKLRSQYGRQAILRKPLTNEVVVEVTSAALALSHPDPDYTTRLRMGILQAIPGVGMGVASAIMAMVDPHTYGVIDFMVWDQLFSVDRRTFTPSDYQRYLTYLGGLAGELDWMIQEVDLALWARAEAGEAPLDPW